MTTLCAHGRYTPCESCRIEVARPPRPASSDISSSLATYAELAVLVDRLQQLVAQLPPPPDRPGIDPDDDEVIVP